MPAKYTLSYFAIMGVAEPIRLLLSYGKIDFEDKRITHKDWPKYKDSMPLGQMPVLDIDGKAYYQSVAICRYLGNQFGLAGSNDMENLQIDMMVDTINEFRQKAGNAHYEKDEKLKAEKCAALKAETIPFYLKKLDGFVAKNNGYFALGKLTWADIYFAGYEEYISLMCKTDITENYPNLKSLKKKVRAIPEIANWYKKDHFFE